MLYITVLYSLLSIFALIAIGLAAPIAGNLGSQSFLRQFVAGITPIQAFPRPRPADYDYTTEPTYLTVAAPWGAPGKAITKKGSAPSFFISHEKLFLFTNDTYILPVNVLNATVPGNPPLQLAVGNRFEGVQGGSWRWIGILLVYDLGGRSNGALYYSCMEKDGISGLYMSLERSSTPPGCSAVTLHAYNSEWQENRKKEKKDK